MSRSPSARALLQIAHVAGMQQVEDAVGEDDRRARRRAGRATNAAASSRAMTRRPRSVDLHGSPGQSVSSVERQRRRRNRHSWRGR